jgi:catechol O-methyltransferase
MASDDEQEDPFACFDDDDYSITNSSEKAEAPSLVHHGESDESSSPQQQRREDDCGVLAFHAGTEAALLNHVRFEMTKQDVAGKSGGTATVARLIQRAETVLNVIDAFCLQRHWMMHIGQEKGAVLQKFILKCLGRILDNDESSHDPTVFVELGTYCGYSSIFIMKTVLKELCRRNQDTSTIQQKIRIYTTEIVELHTQIAQEIIVMSGMDPYIQILFLSPGRGVTLPSKLQEQLGTKTIDFLFIDHDKSLYLQDLQSLEGTGMIRRGTFVAADNVIFAKIDDYREYMKSLASKGVIETRLEVGFLEYSEPERLSTGGNIQKSKKELLRDGIELSIYLQDPRGR